MTPVTPPQRPCRFCGQPLTETFADLGESPLSNAYLTEEQLLTGRETFHPLHAWVCTNCLLVQLESFETPEAIFGDYAYFSSYSDSWLDHGQRYVNEFTSRLDLNDSSHVVELASNDGYLLQYFVEKQIPVLGIEPAANVAQVAIEKGVPTEIAFFGQATARRLLKEGKPHADLLLGNNVLAHVPDLNDFVAGMKLLLAPRGTITMEFPHLLRLIEQNQFDTIYHEHFSYFSFLTVQKVFAAHGLRLFDVQQVPTHGGSLRIIGCHDDDPRENTPAVAALLDEETKFGLRNIETYRAFDQAVRKVKTDLLAFLDNAQAEGKRVVGYGAPAKGNTLLNYCGVGTDRIAYTVDRSIHKQNHYLPGSHLPIHAPEKLLADKPDYVLILPWNIRDEIIGKMSAIRDHGGQFVVPIPQLKVMP